MTTEGLQINVVAQRADEAAAGLNKLSSALKALRKAANGGINLSGITAQVQALSTALKGVDIAGVTALASGFKEIGAAASEASRGAKGVERSMSRAASAASQVKGVTEKASKAMKDAGKAGKQGAGGISKFGAAIKRVLFYRMIRFVLKQVTQAIKEGTQALVEWEYANNRIGDGSFVQTLSNITSELDKIKFNLGGMAAELLQNLEPAIMFVLKAVTSLTEGITEMIAYVGKLFGGDGKYYAANPDYWKQYGEEADEANKQVKKIKSTLLGFDELNVINDDANDGLIAGALKKDERFIEKEAKGINALKTALGIIGTTAGALGLMWGIRKLIGLFTKKNKSLGEQTKKTKEETSAVKELASELAPAAVGVGVFAGALDDIKMPNLEWEPIPDTAKQGAYADGTALGENLGYGVANGLSSVSDTLTALSGAMGANAGKSMAESFREAFNNSDAFAYSPVGDYTYASPDVAGDYGYTISDSMFVGSKNKSTASSARWTNPTKAAIGVLPKIIGAVAGLWIKGKTALLPSGSSTSGATMGNDAAAAAFGTQLTSILPWLLSPIPGLAVGGYPSVGSLFFAGEAGAELVGTVGGKTAVASNGEITGISNAVYTTAAQQNALLQEQNTLLRGILAKSGLRLDGKQIKQSYDTAVRNSGAQIGTGGIVYGAGI